jgi:hypothetical protein
MLVNTPGLPFGLTDTVLVAKRVLKAGQGKEIDTVAISREPCPDCDGQGFKEWAMWTPGEEPLKTVCASCDGTGNVPHSLEDLSWLERLGNADCD